MSKTILSLLFLLAATVASAETETVNSNVNQKINIQLDGNGKHDFGIICVLLGGSYYQKTATHPDGTENTAEIIQRCEIKKSQASQ